MGIYDNKGGKVTITYSPYLEEEVCETIAGGQCPDLYLVYFDYAHCRFPGAVTKNESGLFVTGPIGSLQLELSSSKKNAIMVAYNSDGSVNAKRSFYGLFGGTLGPIVSYTQAVACSEGGVIGAKITKIENRNREIDDCDDTEVNCVTNCVLQPGRSLTVKKTASQILEITANNNCYEITLDGILISSFCSDSSCNNPDYNTELIEEDCPPNTCKVNCGSHYCCYNNNGISVKQIPK